MDLELTHHFASRWFLTSTEAELTKISDMIIDLLTPKHRETHGCVVSIVATDALVLTHQAISIHNAD